MFSFRRLLLSAALLLTVQSTYAWHNDFSIVNNSGSPLTFSITTDQGGAHDQTCQGGNQVMPGHSCRFELTDSYHFPDGTGHKGDVTLQKENGSSCVVHFSYIFNDLLSYSKKRSLNYEITQCSPEFDKHSLSLVSDRIKVMARPMIYLLDLPLVMDKVQKSSESYSKADCADPDSGEEVSDNCIIVSPSMNKEPYSSSVQQALLIQHNIDKFEPLNRAQWIGTHNSAIGPAYTSNTQLGNVSFSDPDNFFDIPKQLESGVSQVEFDILWHKNVIKLCHNHLNVPKELEKVLSGVMCDGNEPMSTAVSQLSTWLDSHPDQMLIVLLDINQDLGAHWQNLDGDLQPLANKIYTPKEAQAFFSKNMKKSLPANTLPTAYLSKQDILSTGKQVVFVANGNEEDLSPSQYLFLHIYNNNSNLLYQRGIDSFSSNDMNCSGPEKYQTMQKMYPDDPGHYNIWRTNGDRTIVNYLTSAKGSTGYNDYLSLASIRHYQNCPFNVMSMNSFGLTCNKKNINACKFDKAQSSDRPLDPRLYALLWSWQLGYPLPVENEINAQAYLIENEAKTGIHFQNQGQIAGQAKRALCHANTMTNDMLGVSDWFTVPLETDISPNETCNKNNGTYATPVTSYQMNDVMTELSKQWTQADPVLVNYKFSDGHWVANEGASLPAPPLGQ